MLDQAVRGKLILGWVTFPGYVTLPSYGNFNQTNVVDTAWVWLLSMGTVSWVRIRIRIRISVFRARLVIFIKTRIYASTAHHGSDIIMYDCLPVTPTLYRRLLFIKNMDADSSDERECSLCEDKFSSRKEFKIHVAEHLAEIKHIGMEYLKSGHEVFVCNICNFESNIAEDVRTQLAEHTLSPKAIPKKGISECKIHNQEKNPAYGRHQLSRPMRIIGPIQI